MDVARYIEDNQIGGKPGREPTDLVLEPERARRVGRHAQHDLARRQPELAHPEREHERQVLGRARAGVTVRGERDGHARGDERARGRLGRVAEEERRARQQDGGRARAGEGVDARRRRVLEVVCAHSAQARRELGAAAVGELVDVQFGLKAEYVRRAEDALGGLRRHGGVLDEGVAEAREPLGGDRGQHLGDQSIKVDGRRGLVLGRHRVGAQKGRHQVDRMSGVERAHGAEHLQLALEIEPVAGLDLGGRHAVREQPVEARHCKGDQVFEGGGARRAHRG